MSIDLAPPPTPPAAPQPPAPPRLLDQLAQAARQRGYPELTVTAFVAWCRRFILFHK